MSRDESQILTHPHIRYVHIHKHKHVYIHIQYRTVQNSTFSTFSTYTYKYICLFIANFKNENFINSSFWRDFIRKFWKIYLCITLLNLMLQFCDVIKLVQRNLFKFSYDFSWYIQPKHGVRKIRKYWNMDLYIWEFWGVFFSIQEIC